MSSARVNELFFFSIPAGLSLMAVSSSGCIMAVSLNGILRRENYENTSNFDDCTNPKFKKILQLLSTISKRSDVFGRYPNVDKILEIVILSVDESYRGQGICKALVERTR